VYRVIQRGAYSVELADDFMAGVVGNVTVSMFLPLFPSVDVNLMLLPEKWVLCRTKSVTSWEFGRQRRRDSLPRYSSPRPACGSEQLVIVLFARQVDCVLRTFACACGCH